MPINLRGRSFLTLKDFTTGEIDRDGDSLGL